MVLRVCISVLHDRHDAEDAFQVTFLALARKAASIRKKHSLASWLHRVAHHVALRALRAAARRRRAQECKAAEMAAASWDPGAEVGDLEAPVVAGGGEAVEEEEGGFGGSGGDVHVAIGGA